MPAIGLSCVCQVLQISLGQADREVFPPEPPVAYAGSPERRAAGKGAPAFGAAERTLAGEHRSGTTSATDERRSGNTFLLVSFEHLSCCGPPQLLLLMFLQVFHI